MKKLIGVLLFVSTVLVALNFQGHQSIVNLGRVELFTAPASATYFINGRLSLPQPTSAGVSQGSQAVVQVSKNGSTLLYAGSPGANGFSIPAVTLVSNDSVAASVTSNQPIDQGLNVIKGDVFFGNKF